jgi:hypothetical protein
MEHLDAQTSDEARTLFRAVNERVREVNLTSGRTLRLADFVCECRDPECTERLTLSIEDFDAVRRDPDRFVVHPGHVASTLERLADVRETYVVVERGGTQERARAAA